tara:strand:+ start:255 stop:614 length:360 start_codon:yes stop_codon:yes gene_type:complete
MDEDLNGFLNYLNQAIQIDQSYEALANLCLALYCNQSILPERFQNLILNKENLALIFSKIAIEKELESYPFTASYYGASFHNTHKKGHWLEVMASVLKLAREPHIEKASKFFQLDSSQF